MALQSLDDIMKRLSPKDQQDVVEYSLQRLNQSQPKKNYIGLSWRGALRDLRDQYTSVELQHKILDWWDEDPEEFIGLRWMGGLQELRDQYTSLELQKKALD